MVHLVLLAQSAQDRDRVLDVGLAHEDDLEAALQRSVFLDVLAIFIQSGCADGPQFAARQRRLQHVGGVNRTLSRSCAHQRVQLVDEQDDLPVGLLDLLQYGLQPIFELATILRACQHRAQVERDHALVLQLLGHVAGDDALREPFDDGGLAHAGLADQHRIVLGAARQHLHYATYLFVASDHGIELALTGQLCQIASVALQRLVLGFGILVGDLLISAHRRQRAKDVVVGRAGLAQESPAPHHA